jgi:hypothetical protein
MKKVILALTLLVIILFLGRNLNPFSPQMFTFHDSTQPVRIQQFVKELKSFHFPPRVAPDMNYGLGYPVFNFYAPSSYWITSIFNLIGFDVVSSLKLSFLLALVVAFFGSYLFLKNYFEFIPSLLGGFLYITSLYFPLNIFVRGNLAEIWFLSFFPLTLFFVYRNSQGFDNKIFVGSSVILSILITSHNILSLVSLPFILIFMMIIKNKRQNFLAFGIALLLSTYFWLPVFTEMKFTWAREVASLTNYRDHFLCPEQLWQSSWGYGGSIKGCINDGMSFMIGKLQLTFFGLGVVMFLWKRFQNKIKKVILFMLVLTLLHILLTLYQSQFLWELLSPISSIVQFPWRLIGPPLLGMSFFSTYYFNNLKIPFRNMFMTIILVVLLIVNGKYFIGQQMTKKEFENKFLSQIYTEKKAAYAVAEYLPKSIDYKYWRSLEKKEIIPLEFLTKTTIKPFNIKKQTSIENIGNIISIFGIVLLWTISKRKR